MQRLSTTLSPHLCSKPTSSEIAETPRNPELLNRLTKPRSPLTISPASPWTRSPPPSSPCPRRAASYRSCARQLCPVPQNPAPGTHLVPTRMSVWIRAAPIWWTSVWALPTTLMTSFHGPSEHVSLANPAVVSESRARGTWGSGAQLTDSRASRVQGVVQPARPHQLLDLRDLGRH